MNVRFLFAILTYIKFFIVLELSLPVFDEGERAIVTEPQPNSAAGSQESISVQRRPIPVSIIDWHNRDETQFIATTGLDFLNGSSQLFIQQTVELLERKLVL